MTTRGWVWLLAAAWILAPWEASGQESTRREEALQSRFMAPCCWTQTVHDHRSGAAEEMRATIRSMLAEGRTDDEITAHFVSIHGEKILAMPRPEGFRMAAYVMPFLVPAAGLWVLVRYLKKRASPAAPAPPAERPVTPDEAERLSRALGERD